MTLHLLLTIFFLALNTFFVLAEFALIKALPSRIEVMHSQGRRRAGIVLSLLDRMDDTLSAIQIGVTLSTLGLGWAGEPYVSQLLGQHMAWPSFLAMYDDRINTVLAFVLIAYTQIVFAELVPRSIALQKAEPIALWVAAPLKLFYGLLRGPIRFMAKSSILVARLLGFKPASEHKDVFTEDEVRVLLGTSQEKGLIPLDRLLLIENLFDLDDLKVKDAMIPREKIAFFSTAKSWDQNIALLKEHHFSRYPLGNPDLDHIVGYIHLKDIVMLGASLIDHQKIVRPISTVDENAALQPLLRSMATQGKHMMMVTRDGRTVGAITWEDVAEELVGEILDEFDAPQAWALNKWMDVKLIQLDLHMKTPLAAVSALLATLKEQEPGVDITMIERLVMNRENQLSTAIGRSVAVPHARVPGLAKPLIVVGRSKEGVAGFSAPDQQPVRLVFLILTPVATPLEQLRVLSRIVALARNATLHKQWMRATTPKAFLDATRTSESLLVG
jgi:CBS domain containing-hemolysin-like protein